MLIVKAGTGLYIRKSAFRAGLDKVWLLKVKVPRSATEAGISDFVGERLIPTITKPEKTTNAYAAPFLILRKCVDENPPFYIDSAYMGGFHKNGSVFSISNMHTEILLNGTVPLMATSGRFEASTIDVIDYYSILTDAAAAAKASSPVRAHVRHQWHFDGSDFCHFRRRLTAVRSLSLGFMIGAQCQKPELAVGQKLMLEVPGSDIASGVEITNEAAERFIAPSSWSDANVAPSYAVQKVMNSSTPTWGLAMEFSKTIGKGTQTSPFYRSAPGKVYMRAMEGETLLPGMVREVAGSFGTFSFV